MRKLDPDSAKPVWIVGWICLFFVAMCRIQVHLIRILIQVFAESESLRIWILPT
jgi:hypothetical protein